MAKTFRPYEPNQRLLLPPNLDEWLPEDHMARFVRDVVGELDLGEITRFYAREDRGFPPYHPRMMTQVLFYADVAGLDGDYICNQLSSHFCPRPYTIPSNVSFPKPKPQNAVAPPSNGKRVKVLHLSDIHLDPRYGVGAEANCSRVCCRYDVHNSASPNATLLPAPLYGSFRCDTPYFLGTSALQAVGPLTGTNSSCPFAWSIYTGDLVSHEDQNQVCLDIVSSRVTLT